MFSLSSQAEFFGRAYTWWSEEADDSGGELEQPGPPARLVAVAVAAEKEAEMSWDVILTGRGEHLGQFLSDSSLLCKN